MKRIAFMVLCFGLLLPRLHAGEVYEVWGGDPDVTWGNVDFWSGYIKIGESTSTTFFAGSYSNYVVATRSRVGVDAVMGTDGTYGSQANQADPWWYSGFTNLYGPPDDVLYILGYVSDYSGIHGQVSFRGNDWTGITVYVKDLPPDAPSVVTSQGDYTNKVVLTWNAVDGVAGYKVARNAAPNYSGATNIYAGTATNLVDTNVADRVPFYYWVQATNGVGASLPGRGFLGYSLRPTGTATRLWTRVWGDTNSYAYTAAIAMDRGGSLYVAGDAYQGAWDGQTNQGFYDGWLTKYTTNGVREWTRMWGSADYEGVRDVAVDSTSGVYAAGLTDGAWDSQTNEANYDAFLIKFSTNGVQEWTRLWGSTDYDYGQAVCADSNNNLYVAGFTYGLLFDGQTNSGECNAFLTKLSSTGARLWSRLWGETNTSAYAVCAGVSNSIYVAGTSYSGFDGQDNPQGYGAFLSKFLTDGTRLWSRIITNGPAADALQVVSDSAGNAYVGGGDGISAFIAKYNASGTPVWFHAQGLKLLMGLAPSASGALWAVSEDYEGAVRLTKINTEGIEQHSLSWNAASLGVDEVVCTPGGEIYFAGYVEGSLGGQAFSDAGNPYLSKWVEGGFPLPAAQALALVAGQPGGVVTGAVGADYSVEFSTNMLDWTTLLVTNRPSMPFQWQDTNALDVHTFYRARIGPP